MNRVDANVVLRYLLNDHRQLSEKAARIIENNHLHISFEVIAEIVYVLMGVYKVTRTEISKTMTEFLQANSISTDDDAVAAAALELLASKKIDFVDAILCAYHNIREDTIFTLDRTIKKLMKEQKS